MKLEPLPGGSQLCLVLQNGDAEIPLLLEVLMLLPGSLSGLGLCFLQLQVLPEQFQGLPKAPLGSTSTICHQQGGVAQEFVQRVGIRNSPSCPRAQDSQS